MKTFRILQLVLMALLYARCDEKSVTTEIKPTNEVVDGIATSTFKVWGNCGMCKETIEASLSADGIKYKSWDSETKVMKISYDTAKISLDEIQKRIAAVGYDTPTHKGNDTSYSGLHECCKYDRKE